MKLDKKDLLLYAVTDRSWLNGESLYSQVEKALIAGTTFLQLREKELEKEDFLKEAIDIKELCGKYQVPFIINDDVDIALKMQADGVHVGQGDMNPIEVRKILGEDKIIGVSVQTVEQAKLAQQQGADYLGVGAVFTTGTKTDAKDVSYEILKEICSCVDIPVVAIGGINKNNISKLFESGICGVAVVSAIFAQRDIVSATKELKQLVKNII